VGRSPTSPRRRTTAAARRSAAASDFRAGCPRVTGGTRHPSSFHNSTPLAIARVI
jgi:hypothetical protein